MKNNKSKSYFIAISSFILLFSILLGYVLSKKKATKKSITDEDLMSEFLNTFNNHNFEEDEEIDYTMDNDDVLNFDSGK